VESAVTSPDAAPAAMSGNEILRRAVHIAVGSLAYLVPVLGWTISFTLSCVAVVANKFLLPHLPGLRRVRDVGRGDRGIWTYPLAIALLLLIFRERLVVAQAGWLALGFGDGTAPFFGRVLGGPRWAFRPDKKIFASLAAGAAAAVAVLPVAPWPVAFVAGFGGALADALPAKVDDNFTWPVFATLAAWAATGGIG
jgi:dolichol kinase